MSPSVMKGNTNQNEKSQRAEQSYLQPAIMGTFPADEVVARRCFIKKVSLVILKNLQENTFAGFSFY